jgi:hypothetical protein
VSEALSIEPVTMRDYHDLEIWRRAMAYAVEVYRLSAQLPDSERYNLTSQLRRAATSVPLNIAEGSGGVAVTPSSPGFLAMRIGP